MPLKRFRSCKTSRLACIWVAIATLSASESVATAGDWMQFRGGPALGIASESRFDLSSQETPTPAWRTEIPGSGWSQPIVVGDRIFLTTAVAADGSKPKGMAGGVTDPSTMGRAAKPKDPVQWKLLSLSLSGGDILSETTIAESVPAFGKHASNTFATETPAASEDTIYVFLGAVGLVAAYDFDGTPKWSRSLGAQKMSNDFGTGSSVLLSDNRLLVQQYNEEFATLHCLEAATGETLWKADREKGSAWSTPILWNNQGTSEVVTAGQGAVIAYDLATGTERWRMSGLDTSFSCSLVADDNTLYYGTSSPGSRGPLGAIAAGHSGDFSLPKNETSSPAVRWSGVKSGAGMPSPVVVGDYLYFVGNTVTCYEKATGKEVYRKRTPGGTLVAGCPLVVGNRILLVNEAGDITVLGTGPEFQVQAEWKTGRADEVYWATPAAADDALLVRSSSALYCYRK